MWKLIKILLVLSGLYIVFWLTTDSWGKKIKQQPTVKKFLDWLFLTICGIWGLALCIVAVAIIPGLLWLVIGIITEFFVWFDKLVIKFNQAYFKLGWWIYVIDTILGTFLFIYLLKRNKDKNERKINV
ncbi:MAG: hypothetical protein WC543_05990 [Candidatus Omnitrophota bacterium]